MIYIHRMIGPLTEPVKDSYTASGLRGSGEYSIRKSDFVHYLRATERKHQTPWRNFRREERSSMLRDASQMPADPR